MSRSDSPVTPVPNAAPNPNGPAPEEPAATPTPTATTGRVWDLVVVGGGIGGLVVAARVACAGRAVLLLEASNTLGGECRGVMQDDHPYDLGVGLLAGAVPGGPIAAVRDRLGVDLVTTPYHPVLQVALPRHRVDLPSGADGWWPEIQREFPEEEEGWHAVVADLAALARDRDELVRHLSAWPPNGWRERFRCWRTLARRNWSGGTREATRRIRKAAETPFQETLAEYGLGAASRQVFEACLWYLLVRGTGECSTLEAAVAVQGLREGMAFPAGGPDALTGLLSQRLRKGGGEIRLHTSVAHVLIERGRIAGVTTPAGETIRARSIVTDLPPGAHIGDLVHTTRGWARRRGSAQALWRPHRIAQLMGVTMPEALVPSALGRHCLVVGDAGRPACDENLVFVRRTSDGHASGPRDGLARLTVGRFVPPTTSDDRRVASQALWEALDRVIPGVAQAVVHHVFLSSLTLGALWGREPAAVRYTTEPPEWLGRRGLRHETSWPNLRTVGPWTYPGRSVADVVEGAMHVADTIIGSARDESPRR